MLILLICRREDRATSENWIPRNWIWLTLFTYSGIFLQCSSFCRTEHSELLLLVPSLLEFGQRIIFTFYISLLSLIGSIAVIIYCQWRKSRSEALSYLVMLPMLFSQIVVYVLFYLVIMSKYMSKFGKSTLPGGWSSAVVAVVMLITDFYVVWNIKRIIENRDLRWTYTEDDYMHAAVCMNIDFIRVPCEHCCGVAKCCMSEEPKSKEEED